MRYGWASWAVLVVLLIAVPTACTWTQAAETEKREIYCDQKYCMVEKQTLLTLLEGLKNLGAKVQELEKLCGWK